jgi:DNA-binding Lrp family transcriptional regulator
MLELLGLSETEAAIYEFLVTNGPGSLTRLARQLSIPRTRVVRGIEVLARKGLVARMPGQAARYMAIQPGTALGALTQAREQELGRARAWMRELDELFDRRNRSGDLAELVEVVDGAEGVWNALQRVQQIAKDQVRCFDAPPYLEPQPAEPNADELSLLNKGVLSRTIYAREGVLVPGRMVHIRAAMLNGAQARTAQVPIKMLIGDNELALIPAREGITSTGARSPSAYLIHPSALLDALSALFEALWERALPLNVTSLPDGGVQPGGVIDESDRRIIAMLASGATDDAIGRALDLSRRTVLRRVHQIMDNAGVQTRFQLGIEARARGWV